MVSSIYSIFQIDIQNLVQNKVYITKNFHIQPSEIERMPYWEYEQTLKIINKMVEEENKQQEEQNKDFNPNSYKSSYRSMMSNMSRNNFSKFK